MATTVEVSGKAEQQLREMEEWTGKQVDDLVRDAVAVLHAQQPRRRPQPKPKAVGIVSDGGIDSSKLDEWLAENWFED